MRWWVRRVKEETQRPQFSPKKERVPRLWWCAYHRVARGRGRQVQEAVVIGRSMVLDIGGVGHSVQGKTWFCWFARTNGCPPPISSGLYSMPIHGGSSSRFRCRNFLDFFHCRHFSKDSHILIKSRLFHSWTKSPNFVTYLSVMETTMSFPPTYHYQMSVCKCMRKRFSCFLKSKSICPLLLFRRGLLISSCFRCDLIRILNVSSFAEAGRVVRVC